MSLTENPENSEEFIVCRQKVGVIDSVKGKIERLFGTRIYFNEVSKDGDKEKRWLKVTGGKWDRQNAKTYILGISEPEETKKVKCSADFLDNEILENIEKNTQAVLDRPSSDSVQISGSELAVTLALSALEELTGCVEDVDSAPSNCESRNKSASSRLNEKLNETFGEGGSSYHSCSSSIKRVILECGTHVDADNGDISKDMLHGMGCEKSENRNTRKASSEVIVRSREEADPRKHYTAPICRTDAPINVHANAGEVVADGVSERRCNESVSAVTEQFPSAARISPVPAKSGRGADAKSLRDFARNVGYTDDEVDEGFLYVDPPMKPTEFLDVLKKVKEEKQKLGLGDHNAGAAHDVHTVRNGDVVVLSDDDDDDLMIVDDHFGKPSNNKKVLSPKNKQGGLSNKEKKKNEQKQKDLAKEFQQQNSKKKTSPQNESAQSAADTQNSSGRKKKQASTQSGNASGTKRKSDPDSDQEQTCVMKIWEPNQHSDSSYASDMQNSCGRKKKQASPQEGNVAGIEQTSNLDQQTCVLSAWDQKQHLMDRDPRIAPRQQRLAGETEPQFNPRATPNFAHPSDPRMRVPHGQGGGYPQQQAVNFDGRPVHGHEQLTPSKVDIDNLRYVIVDGSNVAMFHGNSKVFSCKGIQIAVDYFLDRGHKVTVFVPEWRKYRNYHDNRIQDQDILGKLEEAGHLVFTPSRKINGKLVASYDDRYILSLAEKEDSVILSNDQYRDLMREKASWKKIVEERLLMYRFVGDHFMPAEDPLGRNGPMLDEFLKKRPTTTQTALTSGQQYHQQPQYHNRVVNPQQHFPIGHWQADGLQQWYGGQGHAPAQYRGQGQIMNGGQGPWQMRGRQPTPRPQLQLRPERPRRHDDVTKQLFTQLKSVFSEPEQEEKIKKVLDNHGSETDLNRLTNYCMEAIFQ